jgi:hypothetical protein
VYFHHRFSVPALAVALGAKMDEPWLKRDLLFLRSALKQGMSFAEAAGFLCRDKDEVRKKAKELGLRERVVLRSVRQQIEEAQSAIQKTGIAAALERCRLLLARINAALSGTQPAHFVNTSPVAQGALERAYVVLKKMFERSS